MSTRSGIARPKVLANYVELLTTGTPAQPLCLAPGGNLLLLTSNLSDYREIPEYRARQIYNSSFHNLGSLGQREGLVN